MLVYFNDIDAPVIIPDVADLDSDVVIVDDSVARLTVSRKGMEKDFAIFDDIVYTLSFTNLGFIDYVKFENDTHTLKMLKVYVAGKIVDDVVSFDFESDTYVLKEKILATDFIA